MVATSMLRWGGKMDAASDLTTILDNPMWMLEMISNNKLAEWQWQKKEVVTVIRRPMEHESNV